MAATGANGKVTVTGNSAATSSVNAKKMTINAGQVAISNINLTATDSNSITGGKVSIANSYLSANGGDLKINATATDRGTQAMNVTGTNILTARGGDIRITAASADGVNGGAIVMSGNTTLNADHSYISGTSTYNNTGAKISGNLVASGDLDITGTITSMTGNYDNIALDISNANIQADTAGTLKIDGIISGGSAENAKALYLSGTTLKAGALNITGKAVTGDMPAMRIAGTNTLTAQNGDIRIIASSNGGASGGALVMSGNTTLNAGHSYISGVSAYNNTGATISGTLTASGDLDITGTNNTMTGNFAHSALVISNANIHAGSASNLNVSGKVLGGSAASSTALSVSGSSFDGGSLNILGMNKSGGKGFNISNTTLQGGLADLSSVTLSSAGSAASTTNLMNSSLFAGSNSNIISTFVQAGIENFTEITGEVQALLTVLNESLAAASNGDWNVDWSAKGGGWSFDMGGATFNVGGNANIKGLGFNHANLNVFKNLSIGDESQGLTKLALTNTQVAGDFILKGINVILDRSDVNVRGDLLIGGEKNVTFDRSDVTVRGDLLIGGENVSLKGTDANTHSTITANDIKADTADSVNIQYVDIISQKDINFDVNSTFGLLTSLRIDNANLTAGNDIVIHSQQSLHDTGWSWDTTNAALKISNTKLEAGNHLDLSGKTIMPNGGYGASGVTLNNVDMKADTGTIVAETNSTYESVVSDNISGLSLMGHIGFEGTVFDVTAKSGSTTTAVYQVNSTLDIHSGTVVNMNASNQKGNTSAKNLGVYGVRKDNKIIGGGTLNVNIEEDSTGGALSFYGVGSGGEAKLVADSSTTVNFKVVNEGTGNGVDLGKSHLVNINLDVTTDSGTAIGVSTGSSIDGGSLAAKSDTGTAINNAGKINDSDVTAKSDSGTAVNNSGQIKDTNVDADSKEGTAVNNESGGTINDGEVKAKTDSGTGVNNSGGITDTDVTVESGKDGTALKQAPNAVMDRSPVTDNTPSFPVDVPPETPVDVPPEVPVDTPPETPVDVPPAVVPVEPVHVDTKYTDSVHQVIETQKKPALQEQKKTSTKGLVEICEVGDGCRYL
jgi:hypothetical protein